MQIIAGKSDYYASQLDGSDIRLGGKANISGRVGKGGFDQQPAQQKQSHGTGVRLNQELERRQQLACTTNETKLLVNSVCETALKSLFLAPTRVPEFEYAS